MPAHATRHDDAPQTIEETRDATLEKLNRASINYCIQQKKSIDTVRAILAAGDVDLEWRCRYKGKTALMVACECDAPLVASQLLAAGARQDATCRDGKTAHDWAKHYMSRRCLAILEADIQSGQTATPAPAIASSSGGQRIHVALVGTETFKRIRVDTVAEESAARLQWWLRCSTRSLNAEQGVCAAKISRACGARRKPLEIGGLLGK